MKKKDVTYEAMIPFLQNNHFYAAPEEATSKGVKKITGLRVECSSIMQDTRKARLEEVLKDYPVKVSRDTNNQVLRIKIIS